MLFSFSSQEFKVSSFEKRLMKEIYYRAGKVRIASETETEYDSEQPEERIMPAQVTAPTFATPLKDVRLIEGADATLTCRIAGRPKPKVGRNYTIFKICRFS